MERTVLLMLGVTGTDVSSEVRGGTAQDVELDAWTLCLSSSYDCYCNI